MSARSWGLASVAAWSVVAACDGPGASESGRTVLDATVASDATSAGDTTVASDGTDTTALGDATSKDVCALWNTGRANRSEGSWTGSAASCTPGEYLEPGPTSTLAQVNLFRALAGLPAVELDASKSVAAQACAVLMDANNDIEHAVPASWKCRSEAGVATAGLSNLATTAGVESVDLYMSDDDVASLGHRRWLLSNSLGPIGVGSTARYSCLRVLDGTGHAHARWTAWPPPGEVPVQALYFSPYEDTDAAGWSVQSDYVDLRDGTVTVTGDGAELAVETWQLDEGYGSTWGIGIRPQGWRTTAGTTYHVAIGGLSEAVEWTFTAVDCR